MLTDEYNDLKLGIDSRQGNRKLFMILHIKSTIKIADKESYSTYKYKKVYKQISFDMTNNRPLNI